ncbi:hypothetical protein [Ostreiculturibacter nitratireducens]|uniref:hypothetical protein n=1 Tax=Ostreiculturibacter nitratireducens TaxID=3075226 RepID=UPI0031B6140F
MDSPWNPEILALEIGFFSYALIYLGGLVLLAVRGMRRGIPVGLTIPTILAWGAASIPASVMVFVAAARVFLGES